jgi:hypothetical protein
MDRGTRRHHTARIRIRKNRRLWEEHGRWLWEPGARSKLWWPMHKLTMSSYPKWCQRRTETAHLWRLKIAH